MSGSAMISPCGRYRYRLTRNWDEGPVAMFIMLNPSTADANEDDPTIRRCIGFAQSWGCGGLCVVNLYALISTFPRELWKVDSAQRVGPDNDAHLRLAASGAASVGSPLVAAWGASAKPSRVAWVREFPGMGRLSHLGLNRGGQPKHPLYLRADTALTTWNPS